MDSPFRSDWMDRYRFFRGFEPAHIAMRLASDEVILRYGIEHKHVRIRWEEDPLLECDNRDHVAMGVILERPVACENCEHLTWIEVDSFWGIDLDGPEDVVKATKRLMEAKLAKASHVRTML